LSLSFFLLRFRIEVSLINLDIRREGTNLVRFGSKYIWGQIVFVWRINGWMGDVLGGSGRVPNSPTGQVLEAGPDWLVLVDVGDWTRLTWEVRSGLDWSQTSLHKRSHESQNGTQANTR